MWLADVTAGPLVAGVRVLRNKLGQSFVQPAGNSVGVKTVENQVDNFVTERVVAEFVGRVALNEEAAGRVNSTRPLFQMSEGLKLLPFFGTLENINVRLDVGGELFALQFLGHDPIMKFGLDRNRRRDIAVKEMINEMLGLSVFPLIRMNGQRLFGERIRIALT